MKPEASKFLILELADVVLKSWWTLVAGVCCGLSAALVLLHFVAPLYEARTQVLAASEKLPQDYIRTTVSDDPSVRMGALRESVLSRPYMLNLIKETLGLPPTVEEQDALIRSIRSRVVVNYLRGARFFEINYRDTDPERAAFVANFLANRYIEENQKFRAARAGEATNTLEDLARASLNDLQQQEQAIAAFKSRHPHESSGQLQVNLQLLASRRMDLEEAGNGLAMAQERLQALQAQEAQEEMASSMSILDPGTVVLAPDTRLLKLRAELDDLLHRYSESHPDVLAKKREIEDVQANQTAQAVRSGTPSSGSPSPPKLDLWEAQIRAAEREIAKLRQDEQQIRADIGTFERRIDQTPMVEQELADLSKGVEVLRKQYNDYQGKVESAKGAQVVEEAQKGNQFEVIEKAVPPSLPVWPRPLQVQLVGIVAGLLIFVGPLLLKKLLRPVVGSEAGLRAVSALPILVSIPCIDTPERRRGGRRRRLANVGFSMVSAAILALVFVSFR